ncbi:MAG: type VI secretion system protein TssA, partial [Planctomycetota bacterium]
MSNEIDISIILAPIAGKNPVGERTFLRDQLMNDKKYDKHVDPIDNTEVEIKPNWGKIVETSLEALEKKTKDLWIAAILTEALIHTQGFSGLCTGLKIQTGLLRSYWENVYPSKDNEGDDAIEILEPRLSPINYMNDTLSGCIKEIPITDASKSEGYSWLQWQESRGEDGKDSKTAYGFVDNTIERLSAEDFTSAVNSSSIDFCESLAKDMDLSLEALKELEEIVNKSFGESVTLTKSSPLFDSGENDIPAEVLEKLKPLQNKEFVSEVEFEDELVTNIGEEDASQYKTLIL